MRVTLDLPDPLLRQLTSQAALQGTTLKQLVLDAIKRGPQVPVEPITATRGHSAVPSIKLRRPLRARRFSNAALGGLLDE